LLSCENNYRIMKITKTILLFAAAFMLMTVSCKKSNNKPATVAVSMTFKFNGTAQTTKLLVATYYKSQATVQIAGTNGAQGLSLMIQNPKTGTFDMATDQTLLLSYSSAADFDHTYVASTGKVVITTFSSTNIAGTFSFSGTDGLGDAGAVTEGSFSANLITQ